MFVDRQQVEEPGEIQNVTDGKESLTHVYRVPGVPIKAVCIK